MTVKILAAIKKCLTLVIIWLTQNIMKILAAIKKCLILLIIWLSQNNMMIQIN